MKKMTMKKIYKKYKYKIIKINNKKFKKKILLMTLNYLYNLF